MAPRSKTPYNPSDNSAPFMVLPEHVYGFIDLKTLADIHRYLGESEADEDIALANWVKTNYLHEPIDEGGRTIRTTEGFSNLDRAYRRVRSLTNKAQDKWPFFDRNWKQMSSTTVRNNARGEAAPGVSLPGMNNEAHDSPVTSNFDTTEASLDIASPAPQLQVPFGTKQPSRHNVLGKHHPRRAQQPPILSIPSTNLKKQIQPRDPSETVDQPASSKYSESQFKPEDEAQPEVTLPQAMPQSKLVLNNGEPELARVSSEVSSSNPVDTSPFRDQPKPSAETEVAPLRDAGRGKVRGLNGRFLSKEKPHAVKTRQKSKFATKARPKRQTSADSETPRADVSLSPSTQNGELEDGSGTPAVHAPTQEGEHGNDLSSPALPAFISNNDDESWNRAASEPTSHPHLSCILAAEAEAVASNLDRLPPGFARRPNKRKSEPTSQQGERKRGRHGGIVGRPRKAEQTPVSTDADMGAEDAMEDQVPRMTTRRTTRRSAVSMSNEDAYAGHEKVNAFAPSKPASIKTSEPASSITADPHKSREHSQPGAAVQPQETREDTQAGATTQLQQHLEGSRPGVTSSTSPETISPTYLPYTSGTASSVEAQLHEPREESQVTRETSPRLQLPRLSDAELLAIGLSKTDPPAQKLGSQLANMQQSTLNTPNDASRTHTPGHVEYFARVHTFTGTLEVPIAAKKVENAEDALVRKYAEWMAQEGGMDITFKQFCSIFGFARKG